MLSHNQLEKSDQLHRYLFTHHSVRGELVTLKSTFQQMLINHHYPVPVQALLGEMLVATSLLTATLKLNGDITVQLQGDGPLSLAVINGNNHQEMRGVAHIKGEIGENQTLQEMLGNGYLVITITPASGERYQGVVALEGDSLAEVLENYFHQSEQLPTRLFIRSGNHQGQPAVGGLLLQVLPAAEATLEEFDHLATLTETITPEELFTLPANQVLYRLYHQEQVTLLGTQPVTFRCTCSRQRTAQALRSVAQGDLEQILAEEGQVDMQCDYCGSHYLFSKQDIDELRQTETDG